MRPRACLCRPELGAAGRGPQTVLTQRIPTPGPLTSEGGPLAEPEPTPATQLLTLCRLRKGSSQGGRQG